MKAHAKINLTLLVGSARPDGMHEIATVLQRVELHDDVTVEPADELAVVGFPEDTIVADALTALARAAVATHKWRATLEKRIPVAAGLGGGSSDAAAALMLANATLDTPLSRTELHRVAASIGADVPFFLTEGSRLATGTGTELTRIELPLDYHVVVVLPEGETKESTGSVYAAFDRGSGADGFAARRDRLQRALARIADARDLADLPPNDLAASRVAHALRELGAFRADVSGAGPAVYGLFLEPDVAHRAADTLCNEGATFVTRPV